MEGGFTGVEIMDVAPGSPAEIDGLHVRDVIREINGSKIRSTDDLATTLAQNEPGSKITVSYIFKSNLGWMPKNTVIVLANK
jgi:S1-C subfamily serine protease